jgi:Carboxypeptidase regulatory-like domain/TonB dependent receptor
VGNVIVAVPTLFSDCANSLVLLQSLPTSSQNQGEPIVFVVRFLFSTRMLFFVLGFLPLTLSEPFLVSQGTNLGTITGIVTDSGGAVIPNARVIIEDIKTGLVRILATDEHGSYEATGTKFGSYRITVSSKGFVTTLVNGVALHGTDVVRVNVLLRLAGPVESIAVTAKPSIIQTEQPTISTTIDQQTLQELPSASRDLYQYLYLSPNITQAHAGTFKFIGSTSYGAGFSIDGARTNGALFGEPTLSQPTLESVGELKILSDNFTAEYAGIANIRVETQRGSNRYHGTVFYNNENSALAALTLTDKLAKAVFSPTPDQPKFVNPYFNIHDVGAALGGPALFGRKTFFFVAYERHLNISPATLSSSGLPHPSLWGGDFSQVNDAVKPIVPAGVVLTPDEIAQDTVGGLGTQFIKIPARLLNPSVALLISRYFPKASLASPIDPGSGRMQRFLTFLPGHVTRDIGTARIDHDVNDRNKFSIAGSITTESGRSTPVANPFAGLGLSVNDRNNGTVSSSFTHLFSEHTVNELRAGYNRQDTLIRGNNSLRQFLQSIGFNESDINAYGNVIGPSLLDTLGHFAVNFGDGFNGIPNANAQTFGATKESAISFGDTLSMITGRHSIRAGLDFVRNWAYDASVSNPDDPDIQIRGQVSYTGSGPDAFARFLMGHPANEVSFVQGTRPPMDAYNWEQGYFLQDDFRLHPRVTLSLGLRYELVLPFTEKHDLFVNFDPNFKDAATGIRGRFIVPSPAVVSQIDPRMVAYGVVVADQIGLGRSLIKADKGNIAPRVGIAWRMTPNSVLRGGYGIYYPTSAAQATRDTLASAAFNQTQTKINGADSLSPWPGFNHGFSPLTGGTLRLAGSQPTVSAIPVALKQPRIQHYNLTFERQFGRETALRISYLGTYMQRLITGIDLNMIQPSDQPFATTIGDGVTPCDPNLGNCDFSPDDLARRPFPLLSDFMESFGNFGHARSNALQVELKKNFTHGFTLDASYTLLDQRSTAVDSDNSSLGGSAYNQFQPESDFGRDSFVARHRFITYGLYELPFGKGKTFGSNLNGLGATLAGDWQLSWNMFVKSGTGFTPYWLCSNCDPVFPGNIGSGFIDAVGDFSGSFRPLVAGNPYLRQGNQLFNANAFLPPTVGADLLSHPGVALRNMLQGPYSWGTNLGVEKSFRITETMKVQCGVDLNNAFNHPLLSPNDNTIANLGSFAIRVDQSNGKILPITDIVRNPDFGKLISSFTQEGVPPGREIRLKLRLSF